MDACQVNTNENGNVMPDSLPNTPEVTAFRLKSLEEGLKDLKKSIDERHGALNLMHDQLTQIATALPGKAPFCIAHQLKLEDIEKRIEKFTTDCEGRLRTVESKIIWAGGAVAVIMLCVTLFGPAIRDRLIMPTHQPAITRTP